MPISISPLQARRLTLQHQGLLKKRPFGTGKKGIINAIEQLGYIQIDTISVVKRAHHHTLWTRVNKYQISDLLTLQSKDRKVFEHWSHAAAYLPMRDFRYSLYLKNLFQNGEKQWFKRNERIRTYVLDRIKAEGPLQSKDFENPKEGTSTWYEWKPAKVALEQLYMEGHLMISERKNFQKVFDLTERVLPATVDTSIPTTEEMARYLIRITITAHGFASEKEICYLRKKVRKAVKDTLKEMITSGEVIEINIKGKESETYYTFPVILEKIPLRSSKKQLHILSPFDNSVIQRTRLGNIFGYEYQIECYVPQPKRKFGYFCLPILFGDQFIGRLDAKADRKKSIFYIQSLWLENDFPPIEEWVAPLAEQLKDLSQFASCKKLECQYINPPLSVSELERYL